MHRVGAEDTRASGSAAASRNAPDGVQRRAIVFDDAGVRTCEKHFLVDSAIGWIVLRQSLVALHIENATDGHHVDLTWLTPLLQYATLAQARGLLISP